MGDHRTQVEVAGVNVIDEALEYARKGWPVFPVAPKGKVPLVKRGCLAATTDERMVERWWSRWPDANIGVATGKALGLWVLDVDGPDGSKSLTELENELGPLPDTLESKTGGGGRHLFFLYPPHREIRNRQKIKPGIDVRGEGGYVIVPPSVHASGQKYEWPCGFGRKQMDPPKSFVDCVAPLPKPVAPWERRANPSPPAIVMPEIQTSSAIMLRARAYLDTIDPAVQGRAGHNTLLRAASCLVVGFLLPDDVAIKLLWESYNPRCQPPWNHEDPKDRKDFERKVSEARRAPTDKRPGWLLDEFNLRKASEAMANIVSGQRSAENLINETLRVASTTKEQIIPMDDPAEGSDVTTPLPREDFPVDCLPPAIASYCYQVAEAHNVDLSFSGLPVLSVAGAAMGNAWRLHVKKGFIAPPILWAGLVSPSGTNKSGPLKEILVPLRERLKLGDNGAGGDLASGNTQARAVVSDATLEAVIARMSENPRGLLVFRDELAGWCKSFNAYKKSGGDEQSWLEFWGGGPYTVDRKTNDEQTYIPAAACSVLGGIQPKILIDCFDPGRFASGLVPRILIACPPERDMWWTEAEVDDTATDTWHRVIRWMRKSPFRTFDNSAHKFMPRTVHMTEEAKACYVGLHQDLTLQIKQTKDDNAKAFISKARVTAARIMLIVHVLGLACEGSDDLDALVSLESAEASSKIMRWCLNEQIRVYGFGAAVHRREQAEYLAATIRERLPTPTATVRQVQRLNQRRYKTRNAAIAAMEQLVNLGFARWTSGRKTKIQLFDQGITGI